MTSFGTKAVDFFRSLKAPKLPQGIEAMNPYTSRVVTKACEEFYGTFFNDTRDRVFVFGINPGRFGAGLTGIAFTDPVALEQFCNVQNTLEKRRELSSDFVYRFIRHWGGVKQFYRHFFLTAVSPLGFVRKGVNYNYYDDKALLRASRPFILQTLSAQLALGARRDVAIVLGSGKNKQAVTELNREHRFFERIVSLDHPRFIMQYRRKKIPEYLDTYRRVFTDALS